MAKDAEATVEQKKQVDKSAVRVQQMFGEIAPKYDFLNNLLSVGLAKYWRRRFVAEVYKRLDVVQALDASRTLQTLDVATGTGDVIIEQRRQWRRRGFNKSRTLRQVGVDFTPEMLVLAREKVAKRFNLASDANALQTVEFLEADGCALPFDNAAFDAVTISFGLRNMVDLEKGIAEMARVCRPGGCVAILEFTPTKFPLFAPIFHFYFHHILPWIGQKISKSNAEAYRYLPESVEQFDKPQIILDAMAQNGLKATRRTPLTFGVLAFYIGSKMSEGN